MAADNPINHLFGEGGPGFPVTIDGGSPGRTGPPSPACTAASRPPGLPFGITGGSPRDRDWETCIMNLQIFQYQ